MEMPFEDNLILLIIGLNIILTAVLLYIYLRNLKSIKSRFTVGLVFFSGAFLIENLLDLYFYNSLISQSIFGFTTFHLTVNLLEFIGLLVLLYVTWK
jgi:multisubunit Na+/H+ antiporter MnhC subunit